MATPNLTGVPATIADGESITNWVNDTFALDPDIKVQGSNSVSCTLTTSGNNDIWYAGSWNFSGDVVLRLWINLSFVGNFAASNPIQVRLGDGTNTAFYVWDKGSSYTGGWAQIILYTGQAPLSGTVNKAAVTEIGIRIVTASKPRNVPANCWVDMWTYGDGYTVTGGTSGDPITLSTIAEVDKANAYNIVSEVDGVTFLRGGLQIGNGATTTDFDMDTEVAVFPTEQVPAGLYALAGNGSGANISIVDSVIRSAGTATTDRFDLLMSAGSPGAFTLTGSTLVNGDNMNFATGQTVDLDSFNNVGTIQPNGLTLNSPVIKNFAGGSSVAAVRVADLSELATPTFTSAGTGHAVELTSIGSGSMSWDGTASGYDAGVSGSPVTPTNTGNEAIFVNVSSGTLTINVGTGATTPSIRSAGATVNVVSGQVPITITVLDDTTGSPIATDAHVLVMKDADKSTILSAATDASGVVTTNVSLATYPIGTDLVGWAREMSLTGTDYEQKEFSGKITASGFAATVRLTPISV